MSAKVKYNSSTSPILHVSLILLNSKNVSPALFFTRILQVISLKKGGEGDGGLIGIKESLTHRIKIQESLLQEVLPHISFQVK